MMAGAIGRALTEEVPVIADRQDLLVTVAPGAGTVSQTPDSVTLVRTRILSAVDV